MIDLKLRQEQISRMGGLDGYPTFEPGGYAELVRVAGKCARSEDHLLGVMDHILDNWTKCPKPAEFRDLLSANAPRTNDPNCPECQGSGWSMAENGGYARCPRGCMGQGNEYVEFDKREKPARLREFLP